MISIICVYNNKEILNKFLLKSLEHQSVEYELILIDNTKKRFKSAAEALNTGGIKACGEYLIFTHQDVDLISNEWLKKTENILNSLEKLGIAGVAGKPKNKKGVMTNIMDGTPPTAAGGIEIQKPEIVETLDECLFIIPNGIFKEHKFDEVVCDDWHLYAVDYSLSLKELGLYAYVLPIKLHHGSKAFSFNENYYITLKKLLNKYKNSETWVCTSMGNWNTKIPIIIQKTRIWRFLSMSILVNLDNIFKI